MNLPLLNGIFQPFNQTLVDLFEIRTCSKFILVILNGKLVKSNQKMPFLQKCFCFKHLNQTLVNSFEVESCPETNFGILERNFSKFKPKILFFLEECFYFKPLNQILVTLFEVLSCPKSSFGNL